MRATRRRSSVRTATALARTALAGATTAAARSLGGTCVTATLAGAALARTALARRLGSGSACTAATALAGAALARSLGRFRSSSLAAALARTALARRFVARVRLDAHALRAALVAVALHLVLGTTAPLVRTACFDRLAEIGAARARRLARARAATTLRAAPLLLRHVRGSLADAVCARAARSLGRLTGCPLRSCCPPSCPSFRVALVRSRRSTTRLRQAFRRSFFRRRALSLTRTARMYDSRCVIRRALSSFGDDVEIVRHASGDEVYKRKLARTS